MTTFAVNSSHPGFVQLNKYLSDHAASACALNLSKKSYRSVLVQPPGTGLPPWTVWQKSNSTRMLIRSSPAVGRYSASNRPRPVEGIQSSLPRDAGSASSLSTKRFFDKSPWTRRRTGSRAATAPCCTVCANSWASRWRPSSVSGL